MMETKPRWCPTFKRWIEPVSITAMQYRTADGSSYEVAWYGCPLHSNLDEPGYFPDRPQLHVFIEGNDDENHAQ